MFKIDWSKLSSIMTVRSQESGIFFAEFPYDGAVVIKSIDDPANTFFTSTFMNQMPFIKSPSTKVVCHKDPEYKAM